MSRAVRAIRRIFPRTMIETAGELMHALMQSAAERNIQLLDTSADCQDRQVTPNRFANQRQSRRVARRIVQGLRVARLAAVPARMDIRGTSGEQQSLEPVEHDANIDLRTYRRDQNRQTTRRVDDCVRISLVDPVEN